MIPATHIDDAHKLQSDGRVELFELTPAVGAGTIRFKSDNDVSWRGNTYTGIPLQLSGLKMGVETGPAQPRLIIGQPNIDLSAFKPLVFDGSLDQARVRRLRLLLNDLLGNANIYQQWVYRVRRVESYSRSQITLALAPFSDAVNFTMPFREYVPPAFPSVTLE